MCYIDVPFTFYISSLLSRIHVLAGLDVAIFVKGFICAGKFCLNLFNNIEAYCILKNMSYEA